jgi:ATP-dependent helicase/DNAse subunit B
VPLTLVTGPANSAKAGQVLGGLRARLEEEPVLVVPSFQDVEHAQRELAERGAVFGARVVRFAWLFELIAERAGYAARPASDLQRKLIVEQAVAAAGLRVLAESAGRPGFARAAARFVAELERAMVDPGRLTRALRDWAGHGPHRAYADEIASIYRRYRDGLEAAGLVDPELFAWRALDALRREPAGWGRTPLFVYGFDDFTPLELDALETLAGRCGADVTVSLPYEPGREAFRATAGVHERLAAIATERVHLDAVSDHYANGSREALHHLERALFETGPPHPRDPGGAVRVHVAGGERAEVELAAAELLRLLRDGTAPGDVAVVFRRPGDYASLVEQVFGAYGIPYSIDRTLPFAHTGLGRGLLALLRCAGPEGRPEDLLAWLRTPGKLEQPALADRLEAEARRAGARTAARARELWEQRHPDWTLAEVDRLREAREPAALLAELDRRLQALFAAPYRRRAAVLEGAELGEARAFDAAHRALRELSAVVAAGSGPTLDRHRIHATLAELRVRVGENPQPDRVQVASPEGIRARRFEAVFVCGLQEDEFPLGASPEPFLPDEDRRAIAAASGLRLPLREDRLERERYLFYVCASRAERLLVLSSRYCDEEGDPESPSFFVEDVRDLFEELPERRRSLSAVSWAPEEAPTAAEWERAMAARGARAVPAGPRPLTAEPVLRELAAREAISAGALERFADCPVKWFVEDFLRPGALEPDPEAMVRGAFAHSVLQRTYSRLRDEMGDRRVTPGNLAAAERIALEELEAGGPDFPVSPQRTRVRAAVRRLEFDLLRYLRHEAHRDGLFQPEHLELEFGTAIDGVSVRGRIDRVDTWDGHALVLDYKSGKSADAYKAASWERENRFQAALYMLAVRELLGLEPAGGVYVPLGGTKRQPRGMVAAAVEEVGTGFSRNDRLGPEEFEAKLAWARERIADTAARMERGELRCTPESCAWNGGCSHPSICREEG